MVLCRQPVRPPTCPLLKSGRGRPNAPDESALVMLYIGFDLYIHLGCGERRVEPMVHYDIEQGGGVRG